MAESLGEPVINPSDSHKEKNQLEKSEEILQGSNVPRVDITSDLRVDFREDQDSLYPEYAPGSYRGMKSMMYSQPKMVSGYSRSGYERRHEMYDPEYDKLFPEYDRYLNRPGDSLRSPSSAFYDPYADDLYPSSLPHEEAFSPRSRYDLAYSPRQSRYGNQWEYHDEYSNYLSPRFKHENRWIEHDRYMNEDMDSFSPSYSRYYPSELDMLPGSFPYSSPIHNSPRVSHPMNMRNYDRGDYYPDEMERQRAPFSNPTSPQPGLSASYMGELPRGSLNVKLPSPRGNQSPIESKTPPSSTPTHHAGASTTVNTAVPTAPASANNPNSSANPAGSEESSEKEDENYRIDSKKIMQNLEERTVVLIRNIPNRYKLEDLQQVISAHVDEEYTVLRLPIDAFTKRNLGYAFVSFSDSHEVLKLFLKMNGQRWPNSNSLKKFYMCFAKKQNYVLYENSGENLSNYL